MFKRGPDSTKHHRIQPRNTKKARRLRQDAPIPDRILWGMLRDRQLGGLKFRRQEAIGPFVVDFYCPQAKLVVELNGMTHVGTGEADDRRTIFLRQQGLRVIRLTNDDLLEDQQAIADYILRQAIDRSENRLTPPSP